MNFRPGELTAPDAARLNEMFRELERWKRLSVAAPLTLTRSAGAVTLSYSTPAGFPAELTGPWNAATGYPWRQLAKSGQALVPPPLQVTGLGAVTPDGNTSLAAGARGWLEPDPGRRGWVFLLDTSRGGSGSGSRGCCAPGPTAPGGSGSGAQRRGDGADVAAVKDTLCLGGRLYVTRGRMQVLFDGARLRLGWYDLVTTEEGCCDCPTPPTGGGSPGAGGSGAGGSGGAGNGACPQPGDPCCPDGSPVNQPVIVVDGSIERFAAAFEKVAPGVYETSATDGCAELVARLRCVDGVYRYESVVVGADGSLTAVSGDLAASADGESLEAVIDGYAVSVDHPCPPTGGSGGSGSGGGGPVTVGCASAPIGRTLQASWSNLTGGCAGCLQPQTLTYLGAPEAGWSGAGDPKAACPTTPGSTMFVVLACAGTTWNPSLDCSGVSIGYSLVSVSYDPFVIVYDVTLTPFAGASTCCNGLGGTGRLTITEAP